MQGFGQAFRLKVLPWVDDVHYLGLAASSARTDHRSEPWCKQTFQQLARFIVECSLLHAFRFGRACLEALQHCTLHAARWTATLMQQLLRHYHMQAKP